MYRLRERGEEGPFWEKPYDMPELVWRMLRRRGIASATESQLFIHPADLPLHQPERFPGVPEAAEDLREAIRAGRNICVWGDYDVDGVCACAILADQLERLGASVRVYIPSRMDEGYGLNADGVRAVAAEGADLLITVDCGISDRENVALGRELGMEVIVTDHHRASPEHLPDGLIVAAQMGEYPCPHLCGAGVAYKLACALDPKAEERYVDIAALATVADIVPLTGENRTIVARGLRKVTGGARPGFAALLEEAGVAGRPVTESTFGFQIGPRLNAGGRLGSAERSYRLLRAETFEEARPLASELNVENKTRQALEQAVLADALRQLEGYDFTRRRAIVLRGESWNPGVIGIAASRLLERYHFPVLLLAEKDGQLVGSCRSIEGVDIYLALHACERFFVRYGGHAAAAGLTMAPENFAPFCEALDEWLAGHVPQETYVPVYEYDTEAELTELTVEACDALERLRPFGVGNPAPQVLLRCRAAGARRIGVDGSHLKLWLTDGEERHLDAVWFGHGAEADGLSGSLLAVGAPEKNVYRERASAQFRVRAILREGAGEARGEPVPPAFLTELLYNDWVREEPPVLSMGEAAAMLRGSLQGHVLAVPGQAQAEALCARLDAVRVAWRPDVVFGAWTEGPACFNAVAVCPTGEIPAGVHTVIVAGMPPQAVLPRAKGRGIAVYRLEEPLPAPCWLDDLPGVDELRQVYASARRLAARPMRAREREDLVRETARDAGLPVHAVQAGIAVLEDMELLSVSELPCSFTLGPKRKGDPPSNGLFRKLQMYRERGE